MKRSDVKKRNLLVLQDYANDVPIQDISFKHGVTYANIYRIAFKNNMWRKRKSSKREVEELSPRLEALRQRYRAFDLAAEKTKTMQIRWWDLDITVQPKRF